MRALMQFIKFIRNTVVGIMLIIALLVISVTTLTIALINQIPG